jgi:hypothetical protein
VNTMPDEYGHLYVDEVEPCPLCPKCGKELHDDTVYITHYACACGWSGYYTDLTPAAYANVNAWNELKNKR